MSKWPLCNTDHSHINLMPRFKHAAILPFLYTPSCGGTVEAGTTLSLSHIQNFQLNKEPIHRIYKHVYRVYLNNLYSIVPSFIAGLPATGWTTSLLRSRWCHPFCCAWSHSKHTLCSSIWWHIQMPILNNIRTGKIDELTAISSNTNSLFVLIPTTISFSFESLTWLETPLFFRFKIHFTWTLNLLICDKLHEYDKQKY